MSSDEEFSDNEEMELHLNEMQDEDSDYDEEESDDEKGEVSADDEVEDEDLIKLSKSVKKNIDARKKATAEADDEEEEEKNDEEKGDDLVVKKKLSRSQKRKENIRKSLEDKVSSSVMYLGRIPHGFFEKEMNGYFSQFGKVVNLRLSRNRKTGHSKGYAFIEFESPEVASIVQNTMNGYLLFNHRLCCKLVPQDKIHPTLWKGANRPFKPIPWKKISKARANRPKNAEQVAKITKRLVKKETNKRKKLKDLGIDYEFEGYTAKPRKKHIKFSDK